MPDIGRNADNADQCDPACRDESRRSRRLASSQILYIVSSGQLYQVVVPADQGVPGSGASCLQISLSGIATVVAITGDGTTLNVLAEQPSGQYLVMMVTTNGVNGDGTPKTTVANRFNVATAGGETPELIAVVGRGCLYLVFAHDGGYLRRLAL